MHSAGYWNKAKVAGYSEIQVNAGLMDQMWADLKRWVPKPNGLLLCCVYQWRLRTCKKINERGQKLYKQWTEEGD